MATPSKVEQKLLKGNKKHVAEVAASGRKCGGEEASRHAIILTCMDARIDPLQFGHFGYDQVYVVRNAGGRASDDMIRSMILTIRLFAVEEIIVVQHTDCGMEKVDDPTVRHLLHETLGPAHLGDKVKGHDKGNYDKYHQADYIAFLAFPEVEQSVVNDVAKLRQNPLISKKVKLAGYVYDVETGKLRKIDTSKVE